MTLAWPSSWDFNLLMTRLTTTSCLYKGKELHYARSSSSSTTVQMETGQRGSPIDVKSCFHELNLSTDLQQSVYIHVLGMRRCFTADPNCFKCLAVEMRRSRNSIQQPRKYQTSEPRWMVHWSLFSFFPQMNILNKILYPRLIAVLIDFGLLYAI